MDQDAGGGTDGDAWRARAGSFGSRADVYDRSRPSYPVEAVRWVLPRSAHRVLDLAAGTGKLTGVLLDLGLDVVAVEPSTPMRALLPPRAEALDGRAEAIPVADASVDAVLVGQAFHWFDVDRTLAEVARVLRPGGTLGLLWNLRATDEPWVREVWSLFDDGAEVDRLEPGGAPFAPTTDLAAAEQAVFGHSQSLDPDLLVDLVSSRSGVIVLPEDERVRVLERTRELAPADTFAMHYRTVAWRSVRADR